LKEQRRRTLSTEGSVLRVHDPKVNPVGLTALPKL